MYENISTKKVVRFALAEFKLPDFKASVLNLQLAQSFTLLTGPGMGVL